MPLPYMFHVNSTCLFTLLFSSIGIKNLIVWGNVSGSTFIDLTKAKLYRYESAIWGPPSYFRHLMDMLFDRYFSCYLGHLKHSSKYLFYF